jgi:GTPase SAR1 family protein
MSSPLTVKVRELNLDMIDPPLDKIFDPDQGSVKTIVIGKPGTGKTSLISSLLYWKRHIYPVAMAISGSEDSNHFYRQILPSTFVYNTYDEETIKNFVRRQKIAKQHLQYPWAVMLLDDCTDDTKVFNKPLQHALFKKGRHWKMWYILSLQYAMDVKPVIRVNTDGCFILREPSPKIRKVIWENYAGIIPDFSLFCDIMDVITDDYTALYIHNKSQSNDWRDCVFYYRADLDAMPSNWRFGCDDLWKFHYQRYNSEYVDPIEI